MYNVSGDIETGVVILGNANPKHSGDLIPDQVWGFKTAIMSYPLVLGVGILDVTPISGGQPSQAWKM